MPKIITTDKFIERARKKHGSRYDYSSTKYQAMNLPITVTCAVHGDFSQLADNHLRSGGCNKCAYVQRYKNTRHTPERFIEKATSIHKNYYDYSSADYINDNSIVTITCPVHGEFLQRASSHLQGNACNACSMRPRLTTTTFIEQAQNIHGKYYDYSITQIIDSQTRIAIRCPKHGVFPQYPRVHLDGGQCPGCRPRGYSKSALDWLKWIQQVEGIKIQHAETDEGEYYVPELNLSVDGFCHETNTVYEFYGDVFHGNPSLYEPHQRCGPSIKTAGKLYKTTLLREQKLKTLYTIITIWESQWHEIKKSSRNDGYTLWKKIKRQNT